MREFLKKILKSLWVFFVLVALAGLFGCNGDDEENCEPAAFYGPPPCTDNQDCIDWYGAGWYCDTENTFNDACGNETTWPMCREEECTPAAFYGPQPCESNQDCIDDHGAGWYCDTENTFDDGCGNQYTWPMCKEEKTSP